MVDQAADISARQSPKHRLGMLAVLGGLGMSFTICRGTAWHLGVGCVIGLSSAVDTNHLPVSR